MASKLVRTKIVYGSKFQSEIRSRSNDLGFLGQIPERWNWVVRTTLNFVRTTLANFEKTHFF
ncbi:hypothetical protein GIB67_043261, partial [Kingdonia uniflora]